MESKFATYDPKDKEAKIILRSLYEHEHSETIVSPNGQTVHLEHIMPLSIGEWNIEEDEHEEYCRRIGNMTLLHHTLNERIKNSTFNVKKKEYLKSDIPDTKALANLDEWTIKDIENRQDELLNRVKEKWPIMQI
ncbi:MAG: HNH endonuclease family protein [Candidatus Methanomethylophilaceae archaeon]